MSFIDVLQLTVTVAPSIMNITHTIRLVQNGPTPSVEQYSLILQIGATSEHLCLVDAVKIRYT
jgi:hypothetical protein